MNNTVQSLKRQLDVLIDRAEFYPPSAAIGVQAILEEAVANFKAGGPKLLNQATHYLWMYYRDEADQYSPEDRIELDIPEISSQKQIWEHVTFRHEPTVAIGGARYEPGRSYISFEGQVEWESEHGLQLVFEHGLTVCKVGPYDGHYTNAHAFADESLIGTIYKI